MDDEQIIQLYNLRNAQALTETTKKYGAVCYQTANKILNDSLSDKVIQQHYIDALKEVGAHDNLIITDGSSNLLVDVTKEKQQ